MSTDYDIEIEWWTDVHHSISEAQAEKLSEVLSRYKVGENGVGMSSGSKLEDVRRLTRELYDVLGQAFSFELGYATQRGNPEGGYSYEVHVQKDGTFVAKERE
ncbi:MAG: hypothetical protein WC764_02145 [Candidatus Paceibacterota bacterium]|jgi:hypothetical protein